MIDSQGRAHQPVGAPQSIGGQYMTTPTPEAAADLGLPPAATGQRGVVLEAELPRPGSVSVSPGSSVRGHDWGKVNSVHHIAEGIVEVSCEAHGGVKLSPERNALVPSELRNSDGWYEEDCEYLIAARTFPEAFSTSSSPYWSRKSTDEVFQDADSRVRSWFPDQWEDVTGKQVQPGESSVRDEQRFIADFRAEHGDFRTVSRNSKDIPETDEPIRRSAGEGKIAIIPPAAYNRLRRASEGLTPGVPIPPEYLHDVPVPPRIRYAPRSEHPVTFDRSKLSPVAYRAANKPYRGSNGQVAPLIDLVESRGIYGKTVIPAGEGKVSYYVTHEDNTVTKVPKGIWAALDAPENREATRKVLESAEIDRLEQRISVEYDPRERARLKQKLETITQRATPEPPRPAPKPDGDCSSEATFYRDLETATEAARPWTDRSGFVKFEAPAAIKQRITDLAQFGYRNNLI